MLRKALSVAVLVAALGTAVVPAGAAPPRDALDWQRCAGEQTDVPGMNQAECATLSVPVDWNKPDGPRFGLAVVRRTTKSTSDRVGTLFFGPGGPGDSGLQRVTTGMTRFSTELKGRFDIVSFDPRGVGKSNPVVCSPELLARQPSPVLAGKAAYESLLRYNEQLRADCRAKTGPVHDHVDSVSMAHDLDAFRAALGESRLTFHGSSYGTLLGEMYAEQYPRRIRAMVLESVVDHSLGVRRFLDSQVSTAQDSFDQFVAWCNESVECAWHGRDVRAAYAELQKRADRGRLGDPDMPGLRISGFMLSFETLRRFYEPEYPRLANRLAALEASAPPSGPPVVPTPRSAYPLAIFCQDWNLPVHSYAEYAAHQRRLERLAPDMRYPGALMAVSICLGAPPAHNPQHRLRVHDTPTILLTNSLHDPATGYSWATAVRRQLRTVLLTYTGAGHGTYSSSKCAQTAIDRYLVTTIPPAAGTVCS